MPKELLLTITGRPISKKNHRDTGYNKNTGQRFPVNTGAYKAYEQSVGWQLKYLGCSKENPYFTKPVFIEYRFFMKGKLDTDADGLESGLNDILQNCGVLADDKLIDEHHAKKIRGCDDWKTELVIRELEVMKK